MNISLLEPIGISQTMITNTPSIMCMYTLTVNQLMFAGIRWEDE